MNLNIHQQSLAFGALYEDEDAVTSYTFDRAKLKNLEKCLANNSEASLLVKKFRDDPKQILALLRRNMFSIMNDPKILEGERFDRLERYIPDYFDLMILLDKTAFPSTGNRIYNFVPDYIPEGFSDMGADFVLDERSRLGREKIEVRKELIFNQARRLFADIYSTGRMSKGEIVEKIANWVYRKINYDHFSGGVQFGRKSVRLDEFLSKEIGVCRHYALTTQVLNQAFGLTSRLMKCDSNGGAHAANLVRTDGAWSLLDVTSPLIVKGKQYVCLFPLPEKDIDLNKNIYNWGVRDDNGEREYITRNNMYFRIK
ncbi:MAG: transglutaminase-like domain-containing protein [Nanoarchaeota archaeon]|nr:transglutaminase-like domain-containing protein [Nanoarchaeota archaeon]